MASVPSSALPGLERKPGVQNWIEKLPAAMRAAWHRSIIYRSAKHVAAQPNGMSVGYAIASAKNWAQHICDTGDVKQWRGPQQVRPTSRAECCAAIALWESMRATAKADTSIPADERRQIDLTFQLVDRMSERIDLSQNDTTKPTLSKRIIQFARYAIFGPPIDLAPSTMERKQAESKNQAMPGGRFPIRNASDLDKAIKAVGRARPNTEEERAKVRRFIRRRAQALGLTSRLPDNWKADGSLA